MKGIIDLLGQLPADAINPGDILDPGAHQALQPPKLFQQTLTALGSNSADFFQR
jgi:hypothetical protein